MQDLTQIKQYEMSLDEQDAQRISFAYGNLVIEDQTWTLDEIKTCLGD